MNGDAAARNFRIPEEIRVTNKPKMKTRWMATLVLAATLLSAAAVGAQVFDVHGSYVASTETRPASAGFGIGVGAPVTVGPLYLLPLVGLDYLRASHLGPGRGSAGMDVRLLPSHEFSWGAPYVGASASANWSGGQQSEWSGTRLGLQALGGFLLAGPRASAALKLEERFGYIRGLEHGFTTRLGLIASL
jgi:hypothetical protein